jgi:hypothetical protein
MMKIRCRLGRIAPVENDPEAILLGEQNARRWMIDLEYDPADQGPVTVAFRLLDWRTGRTVPPGMLSVAHTPTTAAAASAAVYFPAYGDGKFSVSIEPSKLSGPIALRLTVDCVHSLMR